jgi:pimeloyl-ACP methyl ester carboxylesterase
VLAGEAERMSLGRRLLPWAIGTATVGVGVALVALDGRMWDAGGPGIVGFEVAGSARRAHDILVEWGRAGRDAARLSLWLDFLYLAGYAAFWALAAHAIGRRARRFGWRRMARLGGVAVVVSLSAAAFNALADVLLLLVLGGHGGRAAPPLAAVCATLTFLCIGAAILIVLVAPARLAVRRWPRGAPATAIAVAVACAVFVGANVFLAERETQAARAEPGSRLLTVAQGTVNVRVDGPRGAPALILIHGFACSLHWWDAVMPELARTHRVIRLDLLGFGNSQKPRAGYSMERQADLVAAVARRLGVRHATIVGHSMGGIVAAALVQRHRRIVDRLITIGTPPEFTDSRLSAAIIPVLPVIGPLIRRWAPQVMLRATIEGGFAPQIDPRPAVTGTVDRTTWHSFHDTAVAMHDFDHVEHVYQRLAGAHVPLLAVFGAHDHWSAHARLYRHVPGARIVRVAGTGHSPQIERPAAVARLILQFAHGTRSATPRPT